MTPGELICIVGPTASGKSELAELCACSCGGAIVSVDSMQVYRGMDIGTAKVPPDERSCPYFMLDVCDPDKDYSVSLYQKAARQCIDALFAQHIPPVLCGGTGLYLNAVLDELDFPVQDRASEARCSYEALAARKGAAYLYDCLRGRDPASAELIHPNNIRRVAVALSLLDEGSSYAAVHAGLHKRKAHYPAAIWGLTLSRDRLYDRINRRVDAMFAQGLVDEVKALLKRGLSSHHTAGQAIGYKEIMEALDGSCSMETAKERIKKRSRNYAKRQISWFSRDSRIQWLDMDMLSFEEATSVIMEECRKDSAHG